MRPIPPPLASGFTWTAQPWGLLLQCVPLTAAAMHGWTTRDLAVTAGAGGWEAQLQQRLARTSGVDGLSLAAVHQVHGASVIPVHAVNSAERPRADGLVSGAPSLALTIRVADCVPLLMADTRLGVVAAVHAGWRGTAQGIAGAAVRRMRDVYGTAPDDLIAALGPSIGPCCYAVGEELSEVFRANGHNTTEISRWFASRDGLRLDLPAANRDQLASAGVPESAIFVSGLCTSCHPAWFYSYRREGAAAGRLVGFIRASGRSRADR